MANNKCVNWYVNVKGSQANDNPADSCHIKETASMTKVDYMHNADEKGLNINPLSDDPGPLYALFPTEK